MKASEFDKNFDEGDDIQNVLDLSKAMRNSWKEPSITAKFSAEEKAIAVYIESDSAVSIDNVENEKKRYTQIARSQMSKANQCGMNHHENSKNKY
ncbi:MAG: hypothetical protein Q8L15_14160 [Methylobacter sp.]|nr:hypothetical protein [Methylobacter sp.]